MTCSDDRAGQCLLEWRHRATGAAVRLVGSGARIQVGGRQYLPDQVVREERTLAPRTEATCRFSDVGISLRLAIEQTHDGLELSGVLHNGSRRPVQVEQLWFAESRVDLGGRAEDYRIYYNSGCQESSGTCRFSAIRRATRTARANLDPDDPDAEGMRAIFVSTCIQPGFVRSQYLTALFCKQRGSAVCLGNTSFRRAETAFFLKPGDCEREVLVSLLILYNGMPLEPGEDLAVEEIAFHADASPLTAVERYVEQVRQRKHLEVKPLQSIAGLWNYWVAFTEAENNAGAELGAMEHQHARLLPYNIRSCPTGVVWHRDNAFFESRCKAHLGRSLAEAAGRMAARFPEFYICGGVFWGAASECSDFFQQHPEAILHDRQGRLCARGPEGMACWTRCPSPGYYVDFSHPAARGFFRKHLIDMKSQVDVRTFNIDFMGDHGEWRGAWAYLWEDDNPFLDCVPYNARMNRPFETDRAIPQAIRETLGPSVVIRSYTALFMRYLGLVDVVRTATDASRVEYGDELRPVRWDELRVILQNLAANYMFHGKWWWSDACGLCVGTRPVPQRTEEFRIRSLLTFIAGGPVTLGDKVARMAPEQFRYCTINIPPTGHAARPLDLFERTVPQILHFRKDRTGFTHDLLTLMNLSDVPGEHRIRLSDLGIEGNCLAFEFWTRELKEIRDGTLAVTLAPRTARHYALHRDEKVPLVLGTDFHLAMGGVELADVRWDPDRRTLSGTVHRPDAETGCLYVHVPPPLEPGRCRAAGGTIRVSGPVVALPIETPPAAAPAEFMTPRPAAPSATRWSIEFEVANAARHRVVPGEDR